MSAGDLSCRTQFQVTPPTGRKNRIRVPVLEPSVTPRGNRGTGDRAEFVIELGSNDAAAPEGAQNGHQTEHGNEHHETQISLLRKSGETPTPKPPGDEGYP